ncbi:hypothetical protein N7513_003247 [Penicillium frequentans]|uniref:Uncharacterized protein n=1 Tax=Penicillium frequentans TaxID=3151616 RepID=A0AAD6G9M3_9EURO|nr:hypothetical protein N7494_013211 [Penicillium glabrum]KAJ5523016.1 hypothetical protein N7494_013202 [Penicillium glabrum]KAJ5544191.1 hypothetical protein N7494_005470 [Penicillium glabrum]KAJ5557661.1 hypothetical protein N7513_003247 [Penicillium glabrum]
MEDDEKPLMPEILDRDRHDWRSAEEYWEAREQQPWIRRLAGSIRRDVAFMSSGDWLQSRRPVLTRKTSFLQAASEVRTFRRKMKKGELSPKEIEGSQKSVYAHYAKAMNTVESWTNYRFPTSNSSRIESPLRIGAGF